MKMIENIEFTEIEDVYTHKQDVYIYFILNYEKAFF